MNQSTPATKRRPTSPTLWYGLPSAIVGLCALGTAIYGYWIQPSRLPAQYVIMLTEFRTQYDEQTDLDNPALVRLGSSIDLCYERLELLGKPANEWERALFYDEHLQRLERRLQASAGNPLENETLREQIAAFGAKREPLFKQVGMATSAHFREANIWLAERMLKQGYIQDEAERLSVAMKRCIAENSRDDQCRILLSRLQIEQAWQANWESLDIAPDEAILRDALRQVAAITDESSHQRRQLRLEILVQVDTQQAIQLANDRSQPAEPGNAESNGIDLSDGILGNWPQIDTQLHELLSHAKTAEEAQQLAQSAAKQVARLLLSGLPDESGAWCTQSPVAVRIVQELDPSSAELASLLWQSALQHADQGDAVSPDLLETILIGSALQPKYLIFALSNAIRGKTDAGSDYLKLAAQSDAAIWDLLGHVAIWYASRDEQYYAAWLALLEDPSARQSNNGVLEFAAGVMRFRMNDYARATEHLKRAQQFLGNVKSITALLEQCEAQLHPDGHNDRADRTS